MKNVWILNHYASDTFFDRGGRHYWFAKNLKARGYEPVIFAANSIHGNGGSYFDDPSLCFVREEEAFRIPYVFVRAREYRGNGLRRLLNMFDFYRNVQKSVRWYMRQAGEKPDVIVASSVHPLTLVAGIRLAKKLRIRCVCEVRDLWPESLVAYGILSKKHPLTLLLRALEKWTYRKADALIFTMEGAYDYIRERGWETAVPREKVWLINNGIDLAQFDENRQAYPMNDTDLDDADLFKAVYVGSIRTVNNVGRLLDAAKHLSGENIRILIWGDGDERALLQKRIEDEGIRNVVLKGRVDRLYIPSITSKADLNLMHSSVSSVTKYGLSLNKMFDYLAAGKPILLDFSSGANPVLASGAGIETADGTPQAIAAGIEAVYALPNAERERMGTAARAGAERYDFARLTDALEEAIAFSGKGTENE